jgi:hypothetical protein
VTSEERHVEEYVTTLLEALHLHMDAATRWDQRVQERVANIKKLYARHPEEQMRKKFEVDYDLNDRLGNYRYHLGEVKRYSAMIQGVVAAHAFTSVAQTPPA